MAYQGFFVLLYIKLEGNKTVLKDTLKNHSRCFPESEEKNADRTEI